MAMLNLGLANFSGFIDVYWDNNWDIIGQKQPETFVDGFIFG